MNKTSFNEGGILTVGKLKNLPSGTVIHLLCVDENNFIRVNSFLLFNGYDGNDELTTNGGFTMPMHGHKNDELIEDFDNCGWEFTVSGVL